ncbi:hypothetical protein Ruko_05050 [Ruthenibacterium sp. TH_2024_36131]
MHGGQPLLIFCKNKNTHRECENDIWPCAAAERFVILYRKETLRPVGDGGGFVKRMMRGFCTICVGMEDA